MNFELARPALPSTGRARTRLGHYRATNVRSAGSDGGGSRHVAAETQHDDTERSADDSPQSASRDRQILVVGAGVTGLALTAFLVQRGYDPVVLGDSDPEFQSRIAVLQPPARKILDRAALSLDLPARTRRTKSLTVRTAEGERSVDSRTEPSVELLQVEKATLRARLRERVPDRLVRMHDIETVTEDRRAVQVTFDNGVREWFDLVVGTDASLSRVQDNVPAWSGLHQYETVFEDVDSGGSLDQWTRKGLAQVRALPDTDSTLVRFTTTRSVVPSGDTLEAGLGLNTAGVESTVLGSFFGTAVDRLDHKAVPQATNGGYWGDGRVGHCGPAAFPVAPASELVTTVGLADAWVLTAELDVESPSIIDAIESYSRRRSRRTGQLVSTPEQPAETSVSDDPLTRFKQFRSVAYSSSMDWDSYCRL